MDSERIILPDLVVDMPDTLLQQIDGLQSSVSALWDRFGEPHLSVQVTSTSQYLSLIGQIETKALYKDGDTFICDTIDIAYIGSAFILPDPKVMNGREVSLLKSVSNGNTCYTTDRVIYVHYHSSTSSSERGGFVLGGTLNIQTSTQINTSAASILGCIAYTPRSSNGTQAIKEIACGEQIVLSFRAVKLGSKYYWILVNQSEAAAKFSQEEASRLLESEKKVSGTSSWTVKANGIVIPRTTASSAFTVTDSMGWVEYIGSGTTSTSMTFPTSLPEGFMCHVQNNSQGAIRVLGCSVATVQSTVPPRSVCMLRRGSGNYVLIFYIASLDTAIRV